jgi:splicing factor U2AF subunit
VGGLPPTANEQNIATFVSNALHAVGGTTAGPGPCAINVYINYEKKFAFVELRTVEEASNAMALDGIMFEGVSVRVRRPNDYNPTAAAALGPGVPNPALNLAAIGLQPGAGQSGGMMQDNSERVFVGGLPYYLTEEQCRELLGSFGPIKSFDLVKDRETGNSKGYGFVVYGDPGVTDVACAGLNGMRMGERVLTVRRATEGGGPGGGNAPGSAYPPMPAMAPVAAPHIVRLQEAVTMEELQNDEEYNDIFQDMQEECAKYGLVNQIIIPRPGEPSGVGKVIINFADGTAAAAAQKIMNGRKFAGRTVIATFLSDDQFHMRQFD